MRNRVKKMVFILSVSVVACSGILIVPSYEAFAMANGSEQVMPMADNIVWKYKMENGIMYKRQYNYTTKKWIGSWIRCS